MQIKQLEFLSHGLLGVLAVMLVASFLLLPLLGFCLVFQVSEAREGVVVYEILRTGEFILPLRHGETIPSKPILFHWIGSVLATLLPHYDEFALRLPSALAAIGVIGVVFALARQCAGTLAALVSVGVLLSSYGFTHLAMDGRVDMLFSLLVVGAISLWISHAISTIESGLTLREMKESTYCFLGLISGFAVLAKGPLGIVLPVLVVVAIAWRFTSSLAGVKAVFRPGWLLAIAVGLPWYILATLSGKDSFLARQIIFENLTRFFGGSGIPSKPFYYYGIHVFSQMAPWFPLACIALLLLWFRGEGVTGIRQRFGQKENLLEKASVIWLLAVFVFLSLSEGKRRAYLLPALPAFSLLFSLYVSTWIRSLDARTLLDSKKLRVGGYFVLALVPLAALGFYCVTSLQAIPFLSSCESCERSMYSLPIAIQRSPRTLLGFFLIFSFGALCCWAVAFSQKRIAALMLSVFLFSQLVFVVFVPSLLGIKGITHSYKFFAERVSGQLPSGEEVTMLLKPGDESFDSFFFYYRKPIRLQNFRRIPKTNGLYLSRRRWLERTPKDWRSNVEEILSGGRLTDSVGESLVLFRYQA